MSLPLFRQKKRNEGRKAGEGQTGDILSAFSRQKLDRLERREIERQGDKQAYRKRYRKTDKDKVTDWGIRQIFKTVLY